MFMMVIHIDFSQLIYCCLTMSRTLAYHKKSLSIICKLLPVLFIAFVAFNYYLSSSGRNATTKSEDAEEDKSLEKYRVIPTLESLEISRNNRSPHFSDPSPSIQTDHADSDTFKESSRSLSNQGFSSLILNPKSSDIGSADLSETNRNTLSTFITGRNPTKVKLVCPIVKEISCRDIIRGDLEEYEWNKDLLQKLPRYNLNIQKFLESTYQNDYYCSDYISKRGYIMEPLSQQEADFPIAYSIMVHTEVELFERLLRAIYRPQNVYCIHVDESSDDMLHMSVRAIAKCFSNVFIPRKLIDVVHSYFSVLEAELLCMRELLKYKKWKYFINLTGQEFPLQTSTGLVKIIKAFNGSNVIEGLLKHHSQDRYEPAGPLKIDGLTLTKGSVHIIAKRAYVEYALTNKIALNFLNWVKNTGIPDETYFSALNHSPKLGVPGSYLGDPISKQPQYPFLARYKNWVGEYPCKGRYIRTICVIGVGDLKFLSNRMELFVNKFNMDYDPLAYACMEELMCNRTLEEWNGKRSVNISYYTQFEFTWNHL